VISIVTPWFQHPELRVGYEAATAGAEVIIVECFDASKFSYAAACNEGLAKATGDIVLMLNNDISASLGWLEYVRRDTVAGALVGPNTGLKIVAGQPMLYVEGWCVAARRETWDALGGFDAETFTRPYWEDVDLSWRAVRAGFRLLRRPWPVTHINGGNTTSRTAPGAYDASEANRLAFERKVRAELEMV
jgi:GT2 family glycosyltransferase